MSKHYPESYDYFTGRMAAEGFGMMPRWWGGVTRVDRGQPSGEPVVVLPRQCAKPSATSFNYRLPRTKRAA